MPASGKFKRHGRKGRAGSVLMETVLVLPIYLMLLGGLFIVGDLMLGRFVLQASGRYEAWSTFTQVEMPDTVFVFRYAEVAPFFHLENNRGGNIDSSPFSTGFIPADSGKAEGNMWAYARIGLTRGTVELPLWTAMFNVPRGTPSTGQDAAESKNLLHAKGTPFCWGFDYHRLSESAIALRGDPDIYRRSNPCASPDGSGPTLQETAIVYDSHFGGEVSGDMPRTSPRKPYQRSVLLSALGD